ncbi:hypothetical protein PIB30_022715 [Stylosanthes scabra]|uniref:Uncharacterized protein n=1 Tax=Stylosanthes scabra TaxID=79078 RepID=A0ABU6Y7F6_9FABA|nr:hypothetical protein [Stylosanthes scabra]
MELGEGGLVAPSRPLFAGKLRSNKGCALEWLGFDDVMLAMVGCHTMIPISRLWMYDRDNYQRGGIKPEFFQGVDDFVKVVFNIDPYKSEGVSRYPCSKCRL